MTGLSLQQIMTSRFRTSAPADTQTRALMESLGLSTKAAVARLAIGRSLALGRFDDDSIDAKGMEVPATSLFTQEDIAIWVGLIVTHARGIGHGAVDSMEVFRALIRQHWHRGAKLLMSDWNEAEEDFDRFLSTLVNRRAELPDSPRKPISDRPTKSPIAPVDIGSQIGRALGDIGVTAEVKGLIHGPRLSRYKVVLKDVNQLDSLRRGLERLALSLNLQNAMPSLIHGDEAKAVFLDIPRPRDSWLYTGVREFREALSELPSDLSKLFVCVGVDVVGKPFSFELTSSPHLLVGGATGQGKTVCLHALILSLLHQHSADDLQLALIDPKRVEFGVYSDTPFLWRGVVASGVDESRLCIDALVAEMDERYERLKAIGASNLREARQAGLYIPFIVTVIDELADLVLQDKNIEGKIVRLAQLARASGIHLVLATQRPDAKTFSGLIRSNIPGRIALTVQKSTESQIILDDTGAEELLGAGDMLIKLSGHDAVRVHGYYITLDDVRSALRVKKS